MSDSRKTLVTLAFALNHFPEDDLAELVAGIEEGIAGAIAQMFDAHPDMTEEWVAEQVEFYGATVSLQQPIRRSSVE